MSTQQHGGPKDPDRDIQRKDVGGDEQSMPQPKPVQPGMGEAEKKTYVPEKERP